VTVPLGRASRHTSLFTYILPRNLPVLAMERLTHVHYFDHQHELQEPTHPSPFQSSVNVLDFRAPPKRNKKAKNAATKLKKSALPLIYSRFLIIRIPRNFFLRFRNHSFLHQNISFVQMTAFPLSQTLLTETKLLVQAPFPVLRYCKALRYLVTSFCIHTRNPAEQRR
jgi:hypothetical protein